MPTICSRKKIEEAEPSMTLDDIQNLIHVVIVHRRSSFAYPLTVGVMAVLREQRKIADFMIHHHEHSRELEVRMIIGPGDVVQEFTINY